MVGSDNIREGRDERIDPARALYRKHLADIVSAGFDRVWSAITGDRALLSAYFGLVAESVNDPGLQAATRHINEGFRALIAQLRGRGRRLRWSRSR